MAGLVATALVIALVMLSTAAGVYAGLLFRVGEVGFILLLPLQHLVIVGEADTLCVRWSEWELRGDHPGTKKTWVPMRDAPVPLSIAAPV